MTSFCSYRPVHTYSIVALDQDRGEMGVAVQSHWFSVGSVVPWAEAGVGAIATQSFANPDYGPDGLALLRRGYSAEETLQRLTDEDLNREQRQAAVLDVRGGAAAFTGKGCIPEAGHLTGENFAVQANLMTSDRVWPEMAAAFRRSEGPLAERLLAALEAAQDCGGDLRGMQSAALWVVRTLPTGRFSDTLVDLRVEDDPQPLDKLQRLLQTARAYEHMERGEEAVEKGDHNSALAAYSAAQSLCPDNLEIRFWQAVALANLNRNDLAVKLIRQIGIQERSWITLTRRLVDNGMLKLSSEEVLRVSASE